MHRFGAGYNHGRIGNKMNDLVQLNEAEIAAVAGGMQFFRSVNNSYRYSVAKAGGSSSTGAEMAVATNGPGAATLEPSGLALLAAFESGQMPAAFSSVWEILSGL